MQAIWDVSALVRAVAETLGESFSAVTVQGELGQFTRAASGHCYFTLKSSDGTASLRCAMFRRAASGLDFSPQEGQKIEVWGRVAVFEPRGELQFIVEAMRQAGAGTLMAQFEQLKARLALEGLFDAARKRAINAYPRRIGVVTSLAAAALHDVVTALQRRAPHVEVLIYPAPVQGVEAPPLLAQAIRAAGRHLDPATVIDTLIVCRGGGSMEDLWAFNDERVVRAIAASPIPVVCGVGHETDITLADFAADARAPTPTAAAEMVAVARADALAALAALARQAHARVQRRLERDEQRLDRLQLRLARPGDGLQRRQQKLDQLARRLVEALHEQQTSRAARLDVLHARLAALDPAHVLARGYAWVRDAAGQPITTTAALSAGDAFSVVLRDGRVEAVVTAALPGASA
jgi:exodeoxyribonuclease VII large subunit